MNWDIIDNALNKEQNDQIALGKAFIDDTHPCEPKDKQDIEYSLGKLTNYIPLIKDSDKISDFYQEINASLCRLRDDARARLNISPEEAGGKQVAQLAKDTQGNMVLNAFAIINQPLVKSIAGHVARNDSRMASRSYNAADLAQAGTYGGFDSAGLLAAAMKYKDEGNKFSTYTTVAIGNAIKDYIDKVEGKMQMIRWPGDSNYANAKYDRHIGDVFITSAQDDPIDSHHYSEEKVQQRESLQKAISRLRERDRMILLARLDNPKENTLVKLGKEFGISKARVQQIQDRAEKRLRLMVPVKEQKKAENIPSDAYEFMHHHSLHHPHSMTIKVSDVEVDPAKLHDVGVQFVDIIESMQLTPLQTVSLGHNSVDDILVEPFNRFDGTCVTVRCKNKITLELIRPIMEGFDVDIAGERQSVNTIGR